MFFFMCFVAKSTAGEEPPDGVAWLSHGKFWQVCCNEGFQCTKYASWRVNEMGMDQYLLIPFLGGWTSIYQLFWCSLGARVLTHPQVCTSSACSNVLDPIVDLGILTTEQRLGMVEQWGPATSNHVKHIGSVECPMRISMISSIFGYR